MITHKAISEKALNRLRQLKQFYDTNV
jgi:hypothetical protein